MSSKAFCDYCGEQINILGDLRFTYYRLPVLGETTEHYDRMKLDRSKVRVEVKISQSDDDGTDGTFVHDICERCLVNTIMKGDKP
jgi:hypothetical protein